MQPDWHLVSDKVPLYSCSYHCIVRSSCLTLIFYACIYTTKLKIKINYSICLPKSLWRWSSGNPFEIDSITSQVHDIEWLLRKKCHECCRLLQWRLSYPPKTVLIERHTKSVQWNTVIQQSSWIYCSVVELL